MFEILIFLIFPFITLILWFFSRNTELPDNDYDSAVTRELNRISLFCYQLFRRKRQVPGSEKVRSYLLTLYGGKDTKEREAEYYAGKISVVILMALVGSFLSLMLRISSMQDTALEDGFFIKRAVPGEGEQRIELMAESGSGRELGDYELVINERRYTPAEADKLFEEASEKMEKTALSENESFDRVTSDLNLVKELEGYPFEVSWKTDNYEVVAYDGEVKNKDIPEDGVIVELKATYKYDDRSWQQVLYANVMPRILSEEEMLKEAIESLISEADENSRYGEILTLPDTYKDEGLVWTQKEDDDSVVLMLLMLAAGGALFVLKDKELKKKIDERSNQILSDYPRFVSLIVLYLGAGMTVRNVFAKLSDDYLKKKEAGNPTRYMYEELVKSTRELGAGKSENAVYESFGRRCSTQEYARLCALLSQNQKKGNGELLRLLQEESAKAFESRMDVVRKKGEEAGTRLLLPMILMLLIVMVVIMIPAYMTF
ncbi:MAG: hypothetical protein IKO76_00510 [Butyrivibrio sp.]|nr:hypothetical protein [Butyrivibrio sp.]